jgi:uncharacterized protein (DUF1778 family)
MADAPKTRGQMAIKSRRLTPEWQARVKKAAARAGIGIGDFIVEAADARALAVLKSEPNESIPAGNPPARLEDVADALSKAVEKIAEKLTQEQAQALEAVRQQGEALERRALEQSATLAALQRVSRRGRWR